MLQPTIYYSKFNIEIRIEESARENIRSVMLWFEAHGNNQPAFVLLIEITVARKSFYPNIYL